jgi:hypothetical protein
MIVKSKTNTAKEIGLPEMLKGKGIEIIETSIIFTTPSLFISSRIQPLAPVCNHLIEIFVMSKTSHIPSIVTSQLGAIEIKPALLVSVLPALSVA